MSDTTENFADFFGTANMGGTGERTTYFKIKNGSNVFRIAPPNRSLAASGKWYVAGPLHYGYTVQNDRDPSKPFHKPFLCIQKKNWDTGMITEECPECSLIARKQEAFNDAVEFKTREFMSQGMNKDEAETAAKGSLKLVARWFQEHNLDRRDYLVAKNEAGQWGVIGIRGKARQAVVTALTNYTKKTGKDGIDPRAGVWVNIIRTGEGVSTAYSAEIVLESRADGLMAYKDGGLTSADIGAIRALPDLGTLHDRNRLNYEQIKVLADSDNNPEIVGRIFRGPNRAPTTTPAAPTLADAAHTAHQVPAAPTAPVTPPYVAPTPAPVAPAAGPDIAAMLAQMEALKKQLEAATAAKPTAPVAAAPTTTPAAPKATRDMTPEEFQKQFGAL